MDSREFPGDAPSCISRFTIEESMIHFSCFKSDDRSHVGDADFAAVVGRYLPPPPILRRRLSGYQPGMLPGEAVIPENAAVIHPLYVHFTPVNGTRYLAAFGWQNGCQARIGMSPGKNRVFMRGCFPGCDGFLRSPGRRWDVWVMNRQETGNFFREFVCVVRKM